MDAPSVDDDAVAVAVAAGEEEYIISR